MKEELKKVRHKSKVVGEVMCPTYETVQEILDAEPEERILAMFNNANTVRIMGNERAKHSGVRTGKKARTEMAIGLLTVDELVSCAGDGAKLTALVESDDIQARVDAKIAEDGVDDVVEETEE